jgi:hypothetical protein
LILQQMRALTRPLPKFPQYPLHVSKLSPKRFPVLLQVREGYVVRNLTTKEQLCQELIFGKPLRNRFR